MPNDNTEALNAAIDAEAAKMGLTPAEVDGGVDLTEAKAGEELQPDFSVAEPISEEPKEDPTPKKAEGEMEENPKDKPEESSDPKEKARQEYKKRETESMFKDFKNEILGAIDEKLKGLATATPAEKKEIKAEVSDDIKEFAGRYKDSDGNPLNAEFLEDFAATIVAKATKNLPMDKIQEVDRIIAGNKAQEETNLFNSDWDKVLPTIKQQYPNASDEQISKAKNQMKEALSTAPVKDMGYILYQEGEKFKTTLFSPKRKTAEGGHVGDADMPDDGDTPFTYESLTPEKATKIQAEIDAEYAKNKK